MLLARLLAALLLVAVFGDAWLRAPHEAGASTFGAPPALRWVALAAGMLALGGVLRAGTRLALARVLALVLAGAHLLGGRVLPCEPGWLLVLAGVLLALAAPGLPASRTGTVALAAAALAIPALAATAFPHGGVLWAEAILPPLALALTVPSLFAIADPRGGAAAARSARESHGRAAEPARVLVLVAGTVGLAGMLSYLTLARGLDVPPAALMGTRLRLVGLHPNLTVPLLVTAIVLAVALLRARTRGVAPGRDAAAPARDAGAAARDAGGSARDVGGSARDAGASARDAGGSAAPARDRLLAPGLVGALVVALVSAGAALAAVGSRTGWIALALGLGLLFVDRLPGRWGALATRAAALGVAALLVLPATGLTDVTIGHRSAEMAAKAVSFRSAMWQMGRDTFAAAPWTGFGPGTSYEQAIRARPTRYDGLPKTDHPHNIVLAVGSALGWPGLLGLALLFGASVRRLLETAPAGVGRGAAAALLAVWASNAVDMGGAAQTLYPSLAFLLLAIAEADALARAGAPRRAHPAFVATAGVLGLLALALGGTRILADHAQDGAQRRLEEAYALRLARLGPTRTHASADAARFEQLVREAAARIARVRTLRPTDPNGPLLARQLAVVTEDHAGIDAARSAARALFPRSAELAFGHAQDLLAIAPRDPRIAGLLDEAIALDPRGPRVWTRHVERARRFALRGEPDDALRSLCDALVINPHAIADLGRHVDAGGVVQIELAEGTAPVPLPEILEALRARRDTEAADDPSTDVRLQMRLVEVLIAADQTAQAEELARQLDVDVPIYPTIRLATAALARDAPEEAVAHLQRFEQRHGPITIFTPLAVELDARSRADPLDLAAFEARLAHTLSCLPDVLFETESLRQVLEARRRVAERTGRAAEVARMDASLAFLAR